MPLLRENGKIIAQTAFYISPNAKGPLQVVKPKFQSISKKPIIPSTATHIAVHFFDSKTKRPVTYPAKIVKASTARKMELI